jgi:protease-4
MDGEETPGNVGGDTTAAQIRDARLDPKVKAIVLRVNSPGGSVSASEVIREELAAAKAAGKPVVVSMGGMAASGGYWISTPANYIVANPSTLTGSIGLWRHQHRGKYPGRLASIPTAWPRRRWRMSQLPKRCRRKCSS